MNRISFRADLRPLILPSRDSASYPSYKLTDSQRKRAGLVRQKPPLMKSRSFIEDSVNIDREGNYIFCDFCHSKTHKEKKCRERLIIRKLAHDKAQINKAREILQALNACNIE